MTELGFTHNTSLTVSSDTEKIELVLTELVKELTHDGDDASTDTWLTMTTSAKVVSRMFDTEGLMNIDNKILVCFLRERDLLEDGNSYSKLSATFEGKAKRIFSLDAGYKKSIGFTVEGLAIFYAEYESTLFDFITEIQEEKTRIKQSHLTAKKRYRNQIDYLMKVEGATLHEAKALMVKPVKEEQVICS